MTGEPLRLPIGCACEQRL